MGGVAGPATTNYLWTDIGFWAMNYAGSQFVWGFTKVSDNCGLIAKHAHAEMGNDIFWMGNNNFYKFNGSGVETMPCSVWDAVFQNIDVSNRNLCFAGMNTAFSEIMFFYPSAAKLGYCDMAAVYNMVEKTWTTVSMQRNTWIDVSVIPNPIATTNAGTVYAHESGNDADGVSISYYFETGYFCRANGEEVAFIDRIYPDAKWGEFGGSQNAALSVYVKTAKSPGGAQRIYGPFSVTQATQFITKKIRGRYIMLRIEGNDLGSFMRLGAIKVRWQSDGRGD
jgi:hypothetical protein